MTQSHRNESNLYRKFLGSRSSEPLPLTRLHLTLQNLGISAKPLIQGMVPPGCNRVDLTQNYTTVCDRNMAAPTTNNRAM